MAYARPPTQRSDRPPTEPLPPFYSARPLLRLLRIDLPRHCSASPTDTHSEQKTHLDSLIRPARTEPRPRHIKRRAEDTRFGLERPGLWDVFHVLEGGAGVVVPEGEGAVVGWKWR
jgi:hypothetical protein